MSNHRLSNPKNTSLTHTTKKQTRQNKHALNVAHCLSLLPDPPKASTLAEALCWQSASAPFPVKPEGNMSSCSQCPTLLSREWAWLIVIGERHRFKVSGYSSSRAGHDRLRRIIPHEGRALLLLDTHLKQLPSPTDVGPSLRPNPLVNKTGKANTAL